MLFPRYLIIFLIFSFNTFAQDYSKIVASELEKLDLSAHELDISSVGRKVKLEGWVSSESDKVQIIKLVQEVEGIEQIDDQIEITTKLIMDDKELVSSRLQEVQDAVVKYMQNTKGAYNFTYLLDEEGVLIKGSAPPSLEAEALIYAISREVSTPVRQDIFVRPWPSDKDLVSRIKDELENKLAYDLTSVDISSANGVVTLRGYKQTHQEVDQIASAVLMIEGVRDLKSEMKYAK